MKPSPASRLRIAASTLALAACACLLFGAAALGAPCAGPTCRPALAPHAATAPHAAVVRIVNALPGGTTCYGSGTLVGKEGARGLVVTCGHLFRQGAGTVTVAFPGGRQSSAAVLAVDPTWDLAALEIGEPLVAPAVIAEDSPRPGEALQSCGFGPDGRYLCNQGRALGYVRTAASPGHETLELSGAAREGDSGGPVFNSRGELVAVVWGTDGRSVEGTYCGRIRKFLAGLLGRGGPPRPQEPSPSGPQTPAGPRTPILGDRLEEFRRRLSDQERAAGDRIDKIEKAVGLFAGLKERLEKAESAAGPENLRAIAREAATGLIAQATPGLWEKLLPAALAALGWTGPPSVALIIGLRVLTALVKRRAAKRTTSSGRAGAGQSPRRPNTTSPLNDDYAGQLAGVYALSGRSPLADATLGREYDEELRRAEESGDGALARWARALRERVGRRFFRIHGEAPMPAEPTPSERPGQP